MQRRTGDTAPGERMAGRIICLTRQKRQVYEQPLNYEQSINIEL